MDKRTELENNPTSSPRDYIVPDVWSPPENLGGTYGNINRATAGARTEERLPRGRHDLQLYSLGTANGKKVVLSFQTKYIPYLILSVSMLKK